VNFRLLEPASRENTNEKKGARGSILVASVSKAGRLAMMPVHRFFIRVNVALRSECIPKVGGAATGASEKAGGIVLNVPTGAAVAIGVGGAAAGSDKTNATTDHGQTVTSSQLSRPFSQSLR